MGIFFPLCLLKTVCLNQFCRPSDRLLAEFCQGGLPAKSLAVRRSPLATKLLTIPHLLICSIQSGKALSEARLVARVRSDTGAFPVQPSVRVKQKPQGSKILKFRGINTA